MTVGCEEAVSKVVRVSKRLRCEVIVCDAPLSHTARIGDGGVGEEGGIVFGLGEGGMEMVLGLVLNVVFGEKWTERLRGSMYLERSILRGEILE